MTPWVIAAPAQFRPGGPPLLTSPRYAADLNEVKTMGSATSVPRTADQTLFARFWNSTSANSLWNDSARSLAEQRNFTLSQNAYLLALLNVAMADAAIAGWEAKYHYVFWRPITAIGLADLDGNPDTVADPAWQPLLVTPAFPEYPSGHSMVSGAAGTVLASVFGENTAFVMASDGMLGVVRSFSSFGAALAEVNDARVFAGIHFRSAVEDGGATGRAVARYVLGHGLLPTAPGQAN
jgi:membrane-associated phospholipid phosphatase